MNSYTITERGGIRIINGELPITVFVALTQQLSADAVFDTDLARMLGATNVFGSPDEINVLKSDPQVRREALAREQARGFPSEHTIWLALGERGRSSNAMFRVLSGASTDSGDRHGDDAHPLDPADFRRCRLLLEQVPALRKDLSRMAAVSPVWKALVDHWDELSRTMDEETPQWRVRAGSSPNTYAMLKRLGC